MSDIAIRVENLSKRYRIGAAEEQHDTFMATIMAQLRHPTRNLSRLRHLTRFNTNGQGEEDVLWALKDVSFEVKRGEVVGVIGRNGAGKSTLLKLLSRITHPSSGRIELHGRVSSLLEVGTGFHPELTGRENIYLNGTILGMRKTEIDRKFDEIVDFSGIEKFIDTPVKRYSSGMGVRLAFSVAAHLEPEILLVDEVLAVGDIAFQRKCLGKMKYVASEGRTVLFVSHNMGAVRNLTDTSIWLSNGILRQEGATIDIINAYTNNSDIFNHSPIVDLASIPRSDKSLRLILTKLRVCFDGKESMHIPMGSNVEFFLEYESPNLLISPVVGIGIDLPDGTRVASMGTVLTQTVLKFPTRRGVVRCSVEEMVLNQGDYTITLTFVEGGQIIDRLEQVCKFTVTPADIYGNGRLPKPEGVCYLRHHWEFEST